MKFANLTDMVGGWFVGDFSPAAVETAAFEVAVKPYAAGATEQLHHHKIATEITVVVSGAVEMAGRSLGPGSIVVLEPAEATAFRAITDCVTVVVKFPSVHADKYVGDG